MTFKILALDGGGTWALIQAKVLQDLYPDARSGHDVLEDFDLVAANSGGAIVAAGLIEGLSPRAILELFRNAGTRNRIFSPLAWHEKNLFRLGDLGARFSTAEKLDGLKAVLPKGAEQKLGELRLENRAGRRISFVFTTYDFDRDRGRFARSDGSSAASNFPRSPEAMTVVEAAHASSTAPVNYFDEPACVGRRQYWDGAVAGYNNPALAGVMEALAARVPREAIRVLSLGTSTVFLPLEGPPDKPYLAKAHEGSGLLTSVKKLASSILSDPPDAHTFIAHLVLGGGLPDDAQSCPLKNSPVVRMNPLIQPVLRNGRWELPPELSEEEFSRLVELDLAATEAPDIELIEKLARLWMEGKVANQPIRSGGGLFNPSGANEVPGGPGLCEVGWPNYAEAKAAWQL